MRLFAIHDAEGNILEVFTSPGNSSVPRPQGRPDLAITEVTIPEDLPRGDADLDNYLRELPKAFRLTLKSPQPAELLSRET